MVFHFALRIHNSDCLLLFEIVRTEITVNFSFKALDGTQREHRTNGVIPDATNAGMILSYHFDSFLKGKFTKGEKGLRNTCTPEGPEE